MEKKSNLVVPWSISPGMKKTLVYMKLTCLIFILGILQVFAFEGYSQKATVSVNLRNATIESVLQSVEDQTEYYFLYSRNKVDVTRKVNVNIEQAKITDLLDKLFADSDIKYKIDGRQIVLSASEDAAVQQKKDVSGKVIDSSGQPLPGVSIIIKGTTTGTITDFNGNFNLSDVSEDATLIFSFVGMRTQEVLLAGKSTFNVVMEEDAIGIEEVVAIGYGVVKKSDLTGAVASVKADELAESATSSVMHMLSGKVAGLQVSQNSAQPGGGVSVLIRGAASTGAGNTPLYVIDGLPVSSSGVEPGGPYSYGSRNPLNAINPNDIESIEVLKDASATAIYGARAANGVILISTKRAKEGSFDVEYSFSYGVQNAKSSFDLLDGPDLMEV